MAIPPLHPSEPEPRLKALSTEQLRPEWLAILERIPGAGLKGEGFPRNVLGQLMHSPELLGPFLEWWVSAKSAMGLSVREQELVILRMGCLYASDYVWKHHVPVAQEFGISDAELDACAMGTSRPSQRGSGPCWSSARPWSAAERSRGRSGIDTARCSARGRLWI